MYHIEFEREKTIETIDEDPSILELALAHNIPHIHACGGNARCSTCRVAILKGLENMNARTAAEKELAERRRFPAHIRLACQARAHGDVQLRRLVIDDQDIEEIKTSSESGTGREMSLAILFSDIRNFTPTTESNLPYDVVHLLNRYFNRMGQAILNYDGYIDKYMGDGIMALFGLEGATADHACGSAVKAALAMQDALQEVNRYAKLHLELELKMGIGIHYGSVIAGEMGHIQKRQFTALGDNVNMAARIEAITKKAKAGILISDAVLENAKGLFQKGRSFRTKLKGKKGDYRLHEVLPAPDQSYKITRPATDTRVQSQSSLQSETKSNPTSNNAATIQMVFSNKQVIAANTLAIRLQSLDSPLDFQAGQWIELGLPGIDERRIFSIASTPRDGHSILLATRLRDSAYKKSLAEMNSGTIVTITEPAGSFTIDETISQPLIFLAGGIGITPIRSILESYLEKSTQTVYLFYSNTEASAVAFQANLDLWQNKYPEFHVISTLTGPTIPDSWTGERGRIDVDLIQKHCSDFKSAHFWIAGPVGFVTSMEKMLGNAQIPSSNIHAENFSGY